MMIQNLNTYLDLSISKIGFIIVLLNTYLFHLFDIELGSEGLSFTQHFVSDDVMPWHEADRACPILFHPDDGTIHMTANLTSQPQQIQVLRFLNEQESVWLDGYRFHLGCNGNDRIS